MGKKSENPTSVEIQLGGDKPTNLTEIPWWAKKHFLAVGRSAANGNFKTSFVTDEKGVPIISESSNFYIRQSAIQKKE